MKQTTGLRQQMQMSPYMMQFLGIIQLPLVDLQIKINQELEANPVLEAEGGFELENIDELPQESDGPQDDFLQGLEEDFIPGSRMRAEEETRIQISDKADWKKGLLSRICVLTVSSKEYDFCEYLINNTDRSGVLSVPVTEAAGIFEIGQERAYELLSAIQEAGPPGFCARNTKESLLLRIKRKEGESVLFRIVDEFLMQAINKRYREIASSLGISVGRVKEEIERLKGFSTYDILDEDSQEYVFPEVEVRVESGQIIVLEISRFIPKLKINRAYLEIARSVKDEKAEEFVKGHINRAKALISAIDDRRKRLVSLVRFLAERQRPFVEEGHSYLRPLTLKEAARFLNTSESTVSRLANQKYVQLPWGIIKIKEFFSNPLSHKSQTGPETTKALILEIIQGHKGKRRPSDNAIAAKLKEMGIDISRRTVNKYRRQLKV